MALILMGTVGYTTTFSQRTGVSAQIGQASFVPTNAEGKLLASGERYDSRDYTAAHKTLPFGTMISVTNLSNGRRVAVRVNDRIPSSSTRLIEVSSAAALALDLFRSGIADVRIEPIVADRVATAQPAPNPPVTNTRIFPAARDRFPTSRTPAATNTRTFPTSRDTTIPPFSRDEGNDTVLPDLPMGTAGDTNPFPGDEGNDTIVPNLPIGGTGLDTRGTMDEGNDMVVPSIPSTSFNKSGSAFPEAAAYDSTVPNSDGSTLYYIPTFSAPGSVASAAVPTTPSAALPTTSAAVSGVTGAVSGAISGAVTGAVSGLFTGTRDGMGAVYSSHLDGYPTASGESYSHGAMTTAHASLPFGSEVTIINLLNNQRVVATVNDRTPEGSDHEVIVSGAVGRALNMGTLTNTPVRIEVADATGTTGSTGSTLGTYVAPVVSAVYNAVVPTKSGTTAATPAAATTTSATTTTGTDPARPFTVQAVSASKLATAEANIQTLGSEAWIQEAVVNGTLWYRVYYGRYATREEAATAKTLLDGKGYTSFIKRSDS